MNEQTGAKNGEHDEPQDQFHHDIHVLPHLVGGNAPSVEEEQRRQEENLGIKPDAEIGRQAMTAPNAI